MTPASAQTTFLDDELFQLTLAAVTQRGRVYAPNLPEKARRALHDTLRGLLSALSPQYETPGMSDPRHQENLALLARTVSARHPELLCDGRFRIGSAQKALNLHLKYRWCLGEIVRPPHCPFDSYVLRAIPTWRNRSWTAIDSLETYADLITAARAVAGAQPLAEWELSVYNGAVKSRDSK
jgi:hypothetical protein